MVTVRLFAGAHIESDQGRVTGPAAQRHRVALLALLAAHPHGISRDRIVAWLWPERDAEHARNLLSQAVYALRRTIGHEAIRAAGDQLQLDCDALSCDTVLFERALACGDTIAAVDLYAGPFLDGFFLSDASEFEHWVEDERRRYQRAFATALESRAEAAAAAGDTAGAVACWQRLAAEDPYNGRVTLGLMSALEAARDRAGAIRVARVHGVLLREEFGAEANPEVERLVERLRTAPSILPAPGAVGPAAGEDGPPHTQAGTSIEVPRASVGLPPARRARRMTGRRAARLATAVILGVAAAGLANDVGPSMPGSATVRGVHSAADVPKIAVLPFADIGGWPENESLADGLTEELIGVLARMRGLRVVGRTSVFAFTEETRDPRAIGRALGVGHLLEGSVRREGDRIRVRALLIDVASGLDVWSETYDRKVDDLFTIWSDLARQIANALDAELTSADRARLAQHAARPGEAHVLYLKGRHFWNRRTSVAYERAIDYFEQSIVADPSHAEAYAGLAITYQLRSIYGDLSPHEAGEHALAAALKALQLDDQLAEAHVALGGYLNAWAWQPSAAERSLLRAIELDPEYAYARHVYAIVLKSMGRVGEELVQRRLAVKLDPLDPHLNAKLGEALLRAGRLDEAGVSLAAAIELDSTYWEAHRSMGELHAAANRPAAAARHLLRAVELAGDMPSAGGSFARTLARIGREGEARRVLARLETQANRSGIYAPIIAAVRADLRDINGAMEWLELAYRQRHPGLALFVADGPLAEEPRYLDLMRRVGRL